MSRLLVNPSSQLVRSLPIHVRALSSQVVVQPKTTRVHVKKGPGGRHSSTGHVATVFGATGFLGRYLVSKLAKAGTQVIVPYRDPEEAKHLKVCGDLGQIVPMEWDLQNDLQIEECLRHSDTVYNLVGRDHTTKNYDYTSVNVTGARRVARIAHSAGVARYIHLSHLNASADSKSAFYRTKFEGEQVVKEAFPEATIVRPSWMFGHEDRLLNSVAKHPALFRINDGQTRISPVHVLDVAEALTTMLTAPSTASSLFVLRGPKTYTFETLLSLVEALTLKKLTGPSIPKPVLMLAARVWDLVWWPTLSPDEVTRRYIDDVPVMKAGAVTGNMPGFGRFASPGSGILTPEIVKGFADLGIEPDVLEDVAIVYLRMYRSSAYYDLPIQSGGIKLRQPTYHVVD